MYDTKVCSTCQEEKVFLSLDLKVKKMVNYNPHAKLVNLNAQKNTIFLTRMAIVKEPEKIINYTVNVIVNSYLSINLKKVVIFAKKIRQYV